MMNDLVRSDIMMHKYNKWIKPSDPNVRPEFAFLSAQK